MVTIALGARSTRTPTVEPLVFPFSPPGTSIHMAVIATLIAAITKVDLQGAEVGPLQSRKTMSGHR